MGLTELARSRYPNCSITIHPDGQSGIAVDPQGNCFGFRLEEFTGAKQDIEDRLLAIIAELYELVDQIRGKGNGEG